MEITNKRVMGYCKNPRTGEQVLCETAIDDIFCDGVVVGYIMGRKPTDNICLVGIPSEALLAALRKKYPGRHISYPSVLLNRDGDPLDIYGEGGDDEDEDENLEEDDD